MEISIYYILITIHFCINSFITGLYYNSYIKNSSIIGKTLGVLLFLIVANLIIIITLIACLTVRFYNYINSYLQITGWIIYLFNRKKYLKFEEQKLRVLSNECKNFYNTNSFQDKNYRKLCQLIFKLNNYKHE